MRSMLLTVLLVAAGLAPMATQAFDARESQEIAALQLTDAAFAKYSQATRGLGALAKQLPGDCGDDDSPQSLASLVAKLDAIPGVKAAIQAAGMTTHEYLVFSFALVQAGVAAYALEQPGAKLPSGVSMANVSFVRAHRAAIEALGSVTQPQCDDDRDEDSRR